MACYTVSSTGPFKSLDQVQPLLKSGDKLLFAGGQESECAGHGISFPSGVITDQIGTGARHIVHVKLPGVTPFMFGRGCDGCQFSNIVVDTSGLSASGSYGSALSFSGCGKTTCRNIGNIGVGRLANLTGSTDVTIDGFDCTNGKANSQYVIYGGAPSADGKTAGPVNLTLKNGKLFGNLKEFLHAIRLHRQKNTLIENVEVENANTVNGRTCINIKEYGPTTLKNVRTKGRTIAIGPLAEANGDDMPDWKSLRTDTVNITDCHLDADTALTIEAGVTNLTIQGGEVRGSNVGINFKPPYSGWNDVTNKPIEKTPPVRESARGVIRVGVKIIAPVKIQGHSEHVTVET